MKLVLSTAAAVAMLLPAAAFAQTAPGAPASAPSPTAAPAPAAAPAAVAKFNLDTPIETIVADEKAKAVLVADLGDVTQNPQYDNFKGMSLNQVAPYAPDKLTAEVLAKIATDLAAIQ